ncbi:MAG: hypothetical protein ACK4RV_14765 [Caulobacter sp.]
MSKRDRRFGAAIVGLILVLACMPLLGSKPEFIADRHGHAAEQVRYGHTKGNAADSGEPTGVPVTEPAEGARQNTGVQWIPIEAFPDWAIVVFTLALAIVAALQLRLDVQNSRDTKAAIAIAKQSADAATATANAAVAQAAAFEESNRIAKEAKAVQTRPWVDFSIEVTEAFLNCPTLGLRITVDVLLQNTGYTTANDMNIRMSADPREMEDFEKYLEACNRIGLSPTGRFLIPGSRDSVRSQGWFWSSQIRQRIYAGSKKHKEPMVMIVVTYRGSTQGERFTTARRFLLRGVWPRGFDADEENMQMLPVSRIGVHQHGSVAN